MRTITGPHSLGQSVEWKLPYRLPIPDRMSQGPTRWGNQLNGNSGKESYLQKRVQGPTRWGNQLNGNAILATDARLKNKGPTRWGNQLNGNQGVEGKYSISVMKAPLAGAIS